MDFDDVGYYEPKQADMILDEYMGKMREALTEATKKEIERLKRENEELKEANKILRSEEVKVKYKANKLEEKEKSLERGFYQKKFSEILEPFINNITVYTASMAGHKQEKCSYCDEKGYLTFTAKNGQETNQPCKCQSYIYWYEPVVCELMEISFFKCLSREGRQFIVTGKFEKDGGDDERWFNSERREVIDTFTPVRFELIKIKDYKHRIVFTSQEECQKCCDYLNAIKKEKE
jgi:hypothetical protein